MRKHWWQSIRGRLALGSALLILLTVGLLALATILATYFSYETDRQTHMNELAAGMAQRVGMDLPRAKNSLSIASRDMLTLTSAQGDYLPIVVNRTNKLIYPPLNSVNNPRNIVASSLVKLTDPSIRQGDILKLSMAIHKGFAGQSTTDQLGQSGPFGFPQPFVVRPIFYDGYSHAWVIGVLILTPRTDEMPSFIASIGRTVLLASLAIAILAALIAIYFSRTITRPLLQLTNAARVMQAGDYTARVPTSAPGEIGELSQTFNEMADQLNLDVEKLRQQELWRRELIMSITHDLATPLTAIAGLGESLVDGVNQSHEDYEATGQIIVRETLRLRRLVKDLHVMAKVEAGALSPQRKPLRLAALVDEVLAVLSPEFERLQVEPVNAIPYNLEPIQADPDMLTRVFSNLCDNALRYTPTGGRVTIDASPHEHMLIFSVSDTGEGIPPEALQRIFERFYRADSARQSTTGGSGLGLAIVQAIIEAHGGSVWAENMPQGGARISCSLPLSSPLSDTLPDQDTRPLLAEHLHSATLQNIETPS